MATRPTVVAAPATDFYTTDNTEDEWSVQGQTGLLVGDLAIVARLFRGLYDSNETVLGNDTPQSDFVPGGMTTLFFREFLSSNGERVTLWVGYALVTVNNQSPISTLNGDVDGMNTFGGTGHTFFVRGARPLGVDGGPFAAANYNWDRTDVVGVTSRVIEGGSVTPGTLDTLLLMFALTTVSSTVSSPSVVATPTGMTMLDVVGGDHKGVSAIFTENLTSAAATAAKTATLSAISSTRTYNAEAGILLAIRAPNTAPTAPGAFTVPAAGAGYKIGQVLSVDFADATDVDGDTLTYDLEYSRDNGTWTPLASALATSAYTWNTLTFLPGTYLLRARAFDGWTYGPYVTTSAFNLVATGPRAIIG